MENQKKLEILVIEDTPEFTAVAKSVYDKDNRLNVTYAATYEDAMKYLEVQKFEGVISDLFFPSQIDWRDKFSKEISQKIEAEITEITKENKKRKEITHYSIDFIKEKEKILNTSELRPYFVFKNDGFPNVEFNHVVEYLQDFQNFRNVSGNPSGLAIAAYCLKEKIPLLIVSQGERHKGDLNGLRAVIRFISELSSLGDISDFLLYQGVVGDELSIEAKQKLERGVAIDKKYEFTWKDAIYAPYTGLLARIKARIKNK